MIEINHSISAVNATLIVASIGLLGIVLGAVITSLTSLFSTWITRRSEDRRHFRELAVRAAISHWEIQTKMDLEVAKTGQLPNTTPLDAILIHTVRVMEIAQNTSLSTKDMIESLAKLGDLTGATISYMKSRYKQPPSAEQYDGANRPQRG